MLTTSAERIVRELPDSALVLDIGGGASPLPRADWVVDLMPYETRGLYGPQSPDEERFSPDTWVLRDVCDPEPLPFTDGQFDFVVCSHTLEDVRDPLAVCREIVRVGKAGYIETPSRLEEQSYGFSGAVGRLGTPPLVGRGDGQPDRVRDEAPRDARPRD